MLALLAAGAAPDLRASRGEAEASASASGGRAVEPPPAELARGAGHDEVAEAIEAAMGEPSSASASGGHRGAAGGGASA